MENKSTVNQWEQRKRDMGLLYCNMFKLSTGLTMFSFRNSSTWFWLTFFTSHFIKCHSSSLLNGAHTLAPCDTCSSHHCSKAVLADSWTAQGFFSTEKPSHHTWPIQYTLIISLACIQQSMEVGTSSLHHPDEPGNLDTNHCWPHLHWPYLRLGAVPKPPSFCLCQLPGSALLWEGFAMSGCNLSSMWVLGPDAVEGMCDRHRKHNSIGKQAYPTQCRKFVCYQMACA